MSEKLLVIRKLCRVFLELGRREILAGEIKNLLRISPDVLKELEGLSIWPRKEQDGYVVD